MSGARRSAPGPVLGGVLLQHPQWSEWLTGNAWGSVFLINVPIVAVGLVGIARVVPETSNPHPQHLDLQGLAISFVGLVALIFGIIHASETKEWLTASVMIPVLFGLFVLSAFLVIEARSDHRSFDVSLFRNRGYAVSLAAVSLSFFALSGITFSLPFYLQVVRGFDTLQAGLCFVPFAAGQLLAAPRSARAVARLGYRVVMTGGLIIVSITLISLAQIGVDTAVWLILVIFFAFGFGMGNVIAPASTVMQNALPLARAGAGSAVQNTVRQVFGALGVAVIGTLLATTYARNVEPELTGLPSPIQEAATESVVAADQVLASASVSGLPADAVEQLRLAVYDSFLSASQMTSTISAIVVMIAAALVGFWLPPMRPPERREAVAVTEST